MRLRQLINAHRLTVREVFNPFDTRIDYVAQCSCGWPKDRVSEYSKEANAVDAWASHLAWESVGKFEAVVSMACSNCGGPAENLRPYRDVCPTDRGDEVRSGMEPICADCLRDEAEEES